MEIKLGAKERRQKSELEYMHNVLKARITETSVFTELLKVRQLLGVREQDAWLQRLALLNGLHSSKIKLFSFSDEGDIVVGDKNEPTTFSANP